MAGGMAMQISFEQFQAALKAFGLPPIISADSVSSETRVVHDLGIANRTIM